MRASIGVSLAAAGAVALLAFTSDVRAAGALVDGVMATAPEDMIPGMPVDHTHYRARIAGTATLPNGVGAFAYSVPVWIVTPADTLPSTALVDPPHTNSLRNKAAVPDGREGERPLAVLALLGPKFLFASGRSYTWVSVRWDKAALATDSVTVALRYDHLYADAHGSDPGTNAAPPALAFAMGGVIIADLADALRSGTLTMRGQTSPQPFANIQLVAAVGFSQTAGLLEPLLFDPLGPGNGAEAHHVPLFDLWLLGGTGGRVPLWPGSSASSVPSATPESSGVVIMVGTEQDVGPNGSNNLFGDEWLRFAGLSHWKSYELAGMSHVEVAARTIANAALLAPDGTTVLGGPIFLPDLDGSVLEAAALVSANRTFIAGGVQRDLTDYFADPAAASADANGIPWLTSAGALYRNPLNFAPFVRALFAAGEASVRYGTPLPENAWLPQADGSEPVNGATRPIPVDAQGVPRFLTDALGNTRGSLQHPFSAAGRGRFYARHPLVPANLQGAYVDRRFLPVPPLRNHGAFVSAVSQQVDALLANGYLLHEDAEAIVEMAERSLEGVPSTSGKPAPEPTGADGEVGPIGD